VATIATFTPVVHTSARPRGSARITDAGSTRCWRGERDLDHRPAATLLVVVGLYKPEMKVEIEVTAKRRTA